MTDVTHDYHLTAEEHKSVFEQKIIQNIDIVDPNVTPSNHPKAVVLAGQNLEQEKAI